MGMAERMEGIKSPGGLVSGIKKMMQNPSKNNHKY
jgi:hypothetical protein